MEIVNPTLEWNMLLPVRRKIIVGKATKVGFVRSYIKDQRLEYFKYTKRLTQSCDKNHNKACAT